MNSGNQAHPYGANDSRKCKDNSSKSSDQIIKEITLGEAIEDFNLMSKVKGHSDKTIELYDYVFKRFLGFMSEEKPVTEIQTRDVREYLSFLMDEGLKQTTVAIHFRHLRAFFNWLTEEDYLKDAPTADISEPKTPSKFPRILSKDQIRKMLHAAKKRKGEWSSYRNYAMLVVFIEMGLRLNELINAELKELDMNNRSLKVHGKGAKDRKVFFGKKTFRTLRHWLKIREHKPEQIWDETIFISQNGDKLKERNVDHLITKIQKKAGLEDDKISPHVLRHTSATLAVENGLNAFQLKSQFGWEEIETALRYVHLSDKSLQESYTNSSPMDNLK